MCEIPSCYTRLPGRSLSLQHPQIANSSHRTFAVVLPRASCLSNQRSRLPARSANLQQSTREWMRDASAPTATSLDTQAKGECR